MSTSANQPTTSSSISALSFTDHLTGTRVTVSLGADGNLLSPAEQRAQIKRSVELIMAATWIFGRRSPGYEYRREKLQPPLGHALAEFPPRVPVRVMCGCVAAGCQRLVAAPADMHVMHTKTWRWASWVMGRVMRGLVSRVQVRLQRRMRSLPVFACAVILTCAAANAGRFSGALLCVAAAAPTASLLFMPCLQAAAAARVQGKPDIFDAAQSGDLALVYDHVTVDASCVSRRESL